MSIKSGETTSEERTEEEAATEDNEAKAVLPSIDSTTTRQTTALQTTATATAATTTSPHFRQALADGTGASEKRV